MTITKAWLAPDPPALRQIPAVLGVYELADTAGVVIYIGMAGGREPFGLRGRIEAHFSDQELNPVLRERAALYRWESNQQYTTQRAANTRFVVNNQNRRHGVVNREVR